MKNFFTALRAMNGIVVEGLGLLALTTLCAAMGTLAWAAPDDSAEGFTAVFTQPSTWWTLSAITLVLYSGQLVQDTFKLMDLQEKNPGLGIPRLLLGAGIHHVKQNNKKRAAAWLQRAIHSGDPEMSVNASMVLANMLSPEKLMTVTRRILHKAQRRNPGPEGMRALIALAEFERYYDHFNQAREELEKVIAFNHPKVTPQALILLAGLDLRFQRPAEAKIRLIAAHEFNTEAHSPQAALILGQLALEQGQPAEALGWFEKSVAQAKGDVKLQALYHVSRMQTYVKNFGSAKATLLQLFNLCEEADKAWVGNMVAYVAEQMGDLDEAKRWYRKNAQGEDPEAASWAAINMGTLLKEQGDTDDAERWMQKASQSENSEAAEIAAAHLEKWQRDESGEDTQSEPEEPDENLRAPRKPLKFRYWRAAWQWTRFMLIRFAVMVGAPRAILVLGFGLVVALLSLLATVVVFLVVLLLAEQAFPPPVSGDGLALDIAGFSALIVFALGCVATLAVMVVALMQGKITVEKLPRGYKRLLWTALRLYASTPRGIHRALKRLESHSLKRPDHTEAVIAILVESFNVDLPSNADSYERKDEDDLVSRIAVQEFIAKHMIPPHRTSANVPCWSMYEWDFSGMIFREADFSQCYFGPKVNFSGAQFLGVTRFSNSYFAGGASFGGANFEGKSTFAKCLIESKMDFRSASFLDSVDFAEVTARDAAEFAYTFFNGPVRFTRSSFEASVTFDAALFQSSVDFSGTSFTSPPSLWGIRTFTPIRIGEETLPQNITEDELLKVDSRPTGADEENGVQRADHTDNVTTTQ